MTAKKQVVETTGKTEKLAKPVKGTLRVKGKGTAVISRFTVSTALPITAHADFSAVKPDLKKAGDLTVFGHNNGLLSIARVIDASLVTMINTGNIDSKVLIESCFSAYTVTSRVVGQPVAKQVDATFVKVISHLKGFDVNMAHHAKYLKKRMNGAGYTAVQIDKICTGLWPTISALRVDYMKGKKAAKAFYDAK